MDFWLRAAVCVGLVMVATLALAGCGIAHRAELKSARTAAAATLDAETAACRQRYPSADQRPVMPRMKCVFDAREKFVGALVLAGDGRDSDIARAVNAKALVIAERYDQQALSPVQSKLELANLEVEFNNGLAQRHNNAAIVAAAQSQAYNANRPRTCNSIGSVTNCY